MTIYNQEALLSAEVRRAQREWDENPTKASFKKYKEAWVKLNTYMQLQKLDAIRHWQEKRRNMMLKG